MQCIDPSREKRAKPLQEQEVMKNGINGEKMTMRKKFQGEIGGVHRASTVQSGMHRASTVQRTFHSVTKMYQL